MKKKLNSIRVIALGYMLMILVGALLLMLPCASRSGESAGFIEALFTATSTSCVTGLVVLDTATSWTLFGQIVIICLIQVGGLGFMTIATLFFKMLKKRMGLREKEIMVESINDDNLGSIMQLTGKIAAGTAIFELLGALLLSIRFIPDFGIAKGIWYSVFHSISAFCNAGFDLMGVFEPYCSLTHYANDALVIITVSFLITVGGLGFLVWDDALKNKHHLKKYRLHTKVVLTVSAILTFGGAIAFLVFERNFTNSGVSGTQALLASLFDSVTARTAGFNSVDTASLSPAGKILTTFLMFIGGSPGSTAGGMKTTTFAVIFISTVNGILRRESKGIFGRRLEKDAIGKASSVAFTNISLALAGIILISAFQPSLELSDVIFEVVSAIGTVGMTTGITRDLETASRLIIIFLMYCGRVGSVSFALALTEKKAEPPVKNPREKITIG